MNKKVTAKMTKQEFSAMLDESKKGKSHSITGEDLAKLLSEENAEMSKEVFFAKIDKARQEPTKRMTREERKAFLGV